MCMFQFGSFYLVPVNKSQNNAQTLLEFQTRAERSRARNVWTVGKLRSANKVTSHIFRTTEIKDKGKFAPTEGISTLT
jgi:hypothetical protein